MSAQTYDKNAVVALLKEILETELAGVVRYTHYALMVFGYSRIPIVSWLRGEATTCLTHANEAGEMVTHLGAHPSLKIGSLLETQAHGINDILMESLDAEKEGLVLYKKLLELVRDRSVFLRRVCAQDDRRRRNAFGRSEQDAAQARRDRKIQRLIWSVRSPMSGRATSGK